MRNPLGAFFSFHLCVKAMKLVFIGDSARHLPSLYFPPFLPNRTAAFLRIHPSPLQFMSQGSCPISSLRDGLD